MRERFFLVVFFVGFIFLPVIMACWALSRYPYLFRPATRVLITCTLALALPLHTLAFWGLDHLLMREELVAFICNEMQRAMVALYLALLLACVGFSIALFGEVLDERKHEDALA
jgi:hypothetical protein